jgi:hypothetical protein
MAKRCAKCGRFFPDDHRVCQVCGVDLVRADSVFLPVPRVRKLLAPKSDGGQKHLDSGSKRDHFKEGEAFETYVANSLFPKPRYVVRHMTTTRSDLKGRFIESAQDPDIRIRDTQTGHSFWIECKWRTDRSIKDRKLIICKSKAQFERYNDFQNEHGNEKVYIVVGFNGKPEAPDTIYRIPLSDLEYPWRYLDTLEPFRRSSTDPFDYSPGRLR